MNTDEQQRLTSRARVMKAMAHPTRLFIVEQLGYGEHCVCELQRMIDADLSTVSKHLALLKDTGIVETDKRGVQVFYRLKVPCILKFMDCIDAVLERSPDNCCIP